MPKIDYATIIPFLLKYMTPEKLGDLVRFYESHKDVIGQIFRLFNRHPAPGVPPIVVPPTPPIIPPKPEPPAAPEPWCRKIVGKVFFVEDDRHGGSGGDILPKEVYDRILSREGPDAQMEGQRVHLDFTPFDSAGREVPSEVVRTKTRPNGDPVVEVSCSRGDLSLESFADRDVGFTPVYVNDEPESGRHLVEVTLKLPAEFNGGLEVVSNVVTWYKD